ncbi:MAG: STAS domain-containing protein [Ferruginibacter sp.]
MNVKIDTKEKFTVITPNEPGISANMTEELSDLLLKYTDKSIPHVILNMKNVKTITKETGESIASLQQQFYKKNCSFVICELNAEVENLLEKSEITDVMNITATESEAWDIVQMEEIERELLRDFEQDENE